MTESMRYPWAERLSPRLLKSPWWIGHIPFAYELIARHRPKVIVELGTYSGSSFAAFCQAVEACGLDAKCYGVDLWQGDVHMGRFEEDLYQEISAYMASTYPAIATLVRKDFYEAAAQFADGSVDLLHIDGTHTYEAVGSDFRTWLPKVSDRGVILFHDTNVTVENAGEAAESLGITAGRLKTLGLVDKVVNEPLGGAHPEPAEAAKALKKAIQETLRTLQDLPIDSLLERRQDRLVNYGKFKELAE